MKKSKWLALTLIVGLVGASASIVAFTYAAYLNQTSYDLPIDINSTAVSAHFTNGGSGTLASPYTISNATDLRTLQQLNVLGIFSKNVYFQMTQNIAYSGAALLPIGNEDYPFYSQFDGNGYTISNLVVNGANTNDIGMFGYVAMGGTVKNFILQAPTINVLPNDTGSVTYAPTTNPMEAILATPATNMGTLTFYNTTPARFTVPRTTIVGTDGATYDIIYTSTDTSLLSYVASTGYWTTGIPDTSNPSNLFSVQLVARAFALSGDLVVSYTLERWQINVKGDGTVEPGSATENPGYFKTVHPEVNPHGTYVGFFIGHLDGNATYLGLDGGNAPGTSNGRINVSGRNVMSYSALIGRARVDNPLDDSASNYNLKLFDFNRLIPEYNLLGTSFTIKEGTSPIVDFATQQSRAITATMSYGLTASEADFFRFYPGLSNTSISYTNPDTSVSNFNVMRINAPLGVGVRTDRLSYVWRGGNVKTGYYTRIPTVRNGFWIWLNTLNSTSSKHVFTSDSFEVRIKINYVATSASLDNRFQIYTNFYNPALLPNLDNVPPDYIKATHWTNLGTSYGADGQLIYNPSTHPVVTSDGLGGTTSGKLAETEIYFIVDQTTTFWSHTWNSAVYYPMLAVGVGKNTSTPSDNYNNTSYHYSYDNFLADAFTLNIINLEVIFTSTDGNITTQDANVDYLYTAPNRSTDFVNGTYIAWNEASRVKVNINVSNYALNTSGTTYAFYRNLSINPLYTFVNVLYSASTAFPPTNTEGYAEAILTGSL